TEEDVVIPTIFTYVPGEYSTQHDLHIGANVISDIPAGEYVYEPSTEPTTLSLETQYSWYISGTDGSETWNSETWTFTTGDHEVIANFEEPNNLGFIGGTHDTDVMANGDASLRIDYTAGTTVATKTFGVPQDWSIATNRAALYLAYKGWDTNADGTLTVELNDGSSTGSVTIDNDDSDVDDTNPLVNDTYRDFEALNIALADFGVDLSNITSIAIKIDSAGSGKVYIDDVRVYAPRCVSAQVLGDVVEGDCVVDSNELSEIVSEWLLQAGTVVDAQTVGGGLIAHWDFEADTNDIVAGWPLTSVGTTTPSTDVPAVGGSSSIDFASAGKLTNVTDANSILATVTDAITISFWAKLDISVDLDTGLITQTDVFWFSNLSTISERNTQKNIYSRMPVKNGNISWGGGGDYLTTAVESSALSNQWSHYAMVLDSSIDSKLTYR
ncbi:MAG: hypothetical protein KAT00_10530, partial [Planctomycetes bacterium]|nr:hypothetical protein [Planctomycetota bacterium]